ncbi:Inositol-3-phosphate synthase [uncultured Desulfobacterium sp.]|uniref:Inositol-3-phosphate synthase n=1 Tax=uncultured Desulfobacterium sp. TaxID=201089 RepID=A0A445N3G2_9BACT|nr:Inositol-3-phosphate synthase [uncultured Desulfobacterium sp.]
MEQGRQIKIAVVGVGNCAASLLQGIAYYRQDALRDNHLGLLHYDLGGYTPRDIELVAAFDIDKRKVGQTIDQAIAAPPNCVYPIQKSIGKKNVIVKMGPVLDGVSAHMRQQPEHRTFLPSDESPVDVVSELIKSEAEILLNYLPVGSEQAARFYAECCLSAGVSLINCIPVFIVSDPEWARRFEKKGIPCVGDDVKSQIGATIIHRTLTKLFNDRGIKLDRTYQLNTGGNTDFLNMLDRNRLESKKISKTEAVQSQLDQPMDSENIHIGPSDYVPWQKDNKVCFIRMEGRMFGGVPMDLELRLSVQDSPNSAGVTIDAIRCCRLARDRNTGGPLTSMSAFGMKHPPIQYSDSEARDLVNQFIRGVIER